MTASMTGFAAHSLNLDHASVNIDLRLKNGVGELRYTFEPPVAK